MQARAELIAQQYPVKIEFLVQLKVFEQALRSKLHRLEEELEAAAGFPLDETVSEKHESGLVILEETNRLFNEMITNLDQEIPAVLPEEHLFEDELDELRQKIIKTVISPEADSPLFGETRVNLQGVLPVIRELIINKIANIQEDNEIRIKTISISTQVNHVRITSTSSGLNNYSFFSPVRQRIKYALDNSPTVDILYEGGTLFIRALNRSLTLNESDNILEALTSFCDADTSVNVLDLGYCCDIATFKAILRGSSQPVGPGNAVFSTLLDGYRNNEAIQSFEDQRRPVQEILDEYSRAAMQLKRAGDNPVGEDDQSNSRARLVRSS